MALTESPRRRHAARVLVVSPARVLLLSAAVAEPAGRNVGRP